MNLLEGDGSLHDDRGHHGVALLDALGDLHLPLAGKQGHLTHLPKIHAHGVAGAAQDAGLEFGLLLFLLLGHVLVENLVLAQGDFLLRIDHLNVHFAEHAHDIVQLVRGHHIRGKDVVHLIVGEVPLFLAQVDQLLHLFHAAFFGHLVCSSRSSPRRIFLYMPKCLLFSFRLISICSERQASSISWSPSFSAFRISSVSSRLRFFIRSLAAV